MKLIDKLFKKKEEKVYKIEFVFHVEHKELTHIVDYHYHILKAIVEDYEGVNLTYNRIKSYEHGYDIYRYAEIPASRILYFCRTITWMKFETKTESSLEDFDKRGIFATYYFN